jgi:hypothetical protein
MTIQARRSTGKIARQVDGVTVEDVARIVGVRIDE